MLAHFGEMHPTVLTALDVEGPVTAFEIFLDALPPEKKKSRAKPPLAASDLLPITRDFAFIVAKDIAAGDLVKAAAGADKAMIRAVTVFDVFEGGNLAAEGKKSIAIEVTIQPVTETLTEQAIDTIAQKIVADVKKATGGELRS
jgi:phenylalanyl-tRNA synthetase beta chain